MILDGGCSCNEVDVMGRAWSGWSRAERLKKTGVAMGNGRCGPDGMCRASCVKQSTGTPTCFFHCHRPA